MIGETILHYKILEKLGEGGMGVVYKAEDTKLKREVAIKFLPRQILSNAEERQRFEIEAQAAAALNHPNIATIYAIEESGNEVFIVMEYNKKRITRYRRGYKDNGTNCGRIKRCSSKRNYTQRHKKQQCNDYSEQ